MDEETVPPAVTEQLRAAGSEVSKQIPPLLKLGKWYLKRAKTTADGGDFAKAGGLFNAALARSRLEENENDENEILREITDTYREFLLAFAKDKRVSEDEIQNEVDFHKKWIADKRRVFKERVDQIDSSVNRNDENEDQYEIHAEKMQEVFRDIQAMYVKLVSMLAEECEKRIGEPPCNYVIIALGSVARMEATPFSDLEFVILYSDKNIGEKINYFRILTHFLHLKVINLGETIIPALGIKELNDFQSSDSKSNWFYDSKTPRGISFDGAMPWASKTPLGRVTTKNKPALELIRTPAEMAELQDEEFSMKEGYHLADIMSRTSYLYGDPTLLDEYNEHVSEKLNTNSNSTEGQSTRSVGFIRGIHQMMLDIKAYNPYYFLGPYCAPGGVFNAKKQFYRLISLLLSDLGQILNIKFPSPWQVITELLRQEIIDESVSASLKVCLSIGNEIRLKTYFENNGQKEVFSPIPEDLSNTEQSVDGPTICGCNEDTLVRLLSTSNNVARNCYDFAMKYFKQDEVDTSLLKNMSFYTPSRAHLIGTLYMRLQNFPKALKYLKLETEPGSVCLSDQGICYGELEEFEKSMECFEKALKVHYQNEDNSNFNVYACVNNIAPMLMELGKYEEARVKLEETIKKHNEIYGEGFQSIDLHDLMLNLGRTYYYCDKIKLAIEAYQKAEEMQSRLAGIPDTSVNHLNLYMAMTLSETDQHARSMEYMKRALQLGHEIFGEHNLSIKLAELYVYAAKVYQRCHLEDDALSFLQRSSHLLQLLLGDNPHRGKINVLNAMGHLFYQKNQTNEAVECFENALKQARVLYHGKQRIVLASTLSSLGMALRRTGSLKESLACSQEAKGIMDSIFGPGHVHHITASILYNLSRSYQQLGDLKQAKKYSVQFVDHEQRKSCHTADECLAMVLRLFTLSQICEDLEEEDEALRYLEEARGIYVESGFKYPIMVTILRKLAMKYLMMGSLEKSRNTFRETAQLAKSFDSCPDNVKEVFHMLELVLNQ